MAKNGMRRYRSGDDQDVKNFRGIKVKNKEESVPEIQGKAKSGKEKAGPM
ncbi:MAG: hypothetical protein Q8882_01020 [Bacillota bacterium]|nr:hypothetical protein [Bacillota bacterium]